MKAIAILCFVISFTALSAQNLQISRYYAGNAKNVPVHIYNHNASHFYVLRYNKSIHDFVIEKRSKPGAELQHIYPLRLDSVNSKWFDYENLDYLLFEKQGNLFFVFVKELNSQSSVFMKRIDGRGKISGFIPIYSAAVDPSKGTVRFKLELTAAKNVLIQQKNKFSNQTAKTSLIAYEPVEQKIVRQFQLPPENNYTGYSTAYTLANDSTLYYLLAFSRVASFSKQYSTQGIAEVPLFITDSAVVVKLNSQHTLLRSSLPFKNLYGQFNVYLLPNANELQLVFRAAAESDSGLVQQFYAASYNATNLSLIAATVTALNKGLAEKLNYYDGTDDAAAGAKSFMGISVRFTRGNFEIVEGRREGNFFKELLYWNYDTLRKTVNNQQLIPRKVFYFPNRTAYRQQAEVGVVTTPGTTSLFLLEHRGNRRVMPEQYHHRSFVKQTQLRTGVLTQYTIDNGIVKKRSVFDNAEFDWVPLRYDGWEKDYVFYLARHKTEKWAILPDLHF